MRPPDQAMQQVNFLARGVFPEKLDAAVAQLEAEPAGIGLDPAEVYEGLSHAASSVLAAVSRVAQRIGPGHERRRRRNEMEARCTKDVVKRIASRIIH